jgi:RNA polymerase sigma-70 factor (ECF subfamily)
MLVDFHTVFDRHSGDVHRFALYLSGDPSLAEEITQETFVRAWVVPGEITGGTVKAYLLTIARNLYRAERKRRTRETTSGRIDCRSPNRRSGVGESTV